MPSRTPRPESETFCYCIKAKRRWAVIGIMIFFGVSFLLLLFVWGVTSNLVAPADEEESPSEESLQELRNSNKYLQTKLQELEKKLNLAGEMIGEVHSDCNFYGRHHHSPKVERSSIEMRVEDWATEINSGSARDLQDASSTSFQAGEKLGPLFHSSWTLYLSKGTGSGINLHLALDKWEAGVNGLSLWAAFSAQVTRSDESIAISRRHPVTNVMDNMVTGSDSEDESWPEMVIPNFLTLDVVPPLLVNGSLTIKAELELFGQGSRLYHPKIATPPQTDKQKVIFAVDSSKSTSNSSNSSSSVTFSKSVLSHPWGSESKWTASVERQNLSNIRSNGSGGGSLTFSLTLIQVWDDEVEWDQFWGSFSLHVQQGREVTTTTAPLHDFMSTPRLTLANILTPKINANNSTNNNNATFDDIFEFTISLTVFNRNARFYIDLR